MILSWASLLLLLVLPPLLSWVVTHERRWKWGGQYAIAAVTLAVIGITAAVFVRPFSDTEGFGAFYTVNAYRGAIALAGLYLAISLLHLTLAMLRWPVPARLASLQFWAFHLSICLSIAQSIFHLAQLHAWYADYTTTFVWSDRTAALSSILIVTAMGLLLGLLATSGYLRFRRGKTA